MPPIEGDLDMCEKAEAVSDARLDNLAKMYDVPRTCPWKPVYFNLLTLF